MRTSMMLTLCVFAALLLLHAPVISACTTVGVGKRASVDGATYCAHSNDGDDDTDPRLVRVPARDYSSGTMRPIYWAPEEYPRYVGYEREVEAYYPNSANETEFEPIGYIPQVSHTYAYFEQTYGAMNEMGLGMAESTCSSIYGTTAIGHGGNSLLSVDTLTQIAMERCTTARDAIETMGSLSEKYGFYGPGSFEGSGESLIVTDQDEVWVFHILSDPTGNSSIWAAQRIPEDSFTVVANMYVIRAINFTDTDNFLYSSNIKTIALEEDLWTSGTTFDFTLIYSAGEYAHKYYSGRRMWGAYRLAVPSLGLSPNYDNLLYTAYPTHATVQTPLSLQNVTSIMRDYYQGTQFDLTQGLAAGPFGTPDRYEGGKGESQVSGNWERAIGLYRTSDSFVVQIRGDVDVATGAVLWFGPHAAHGTCYVPLAAAMTDVPSSYSIGHQLEFNRNAAFWAFRYVENMANLKWSYMIQDVQKAQQIWETKGEELVAAMDADWAANADIFTVTKTFQKHAEQVVSRWWNLADELMFTYADGYINNGKKQTTPGYPAWWLKDVNYTGGPPPPPSVKLAHVTHDEM